MTPYEAGRAYVQAELARESRYAALPIETTAELIERTATWSDDYRELPYPDRIEFRRGLERELANERKRRRR